MGTDSAYPVREAQRLLIHTMNGRRFFSLIPPGEFTNSGLGTYSIHELKDGLETKSIDELVRLFTAAPDAKPKRRAWETDPALRLAMINRLAAIIQQSTETGERENAKALYKRLTGQDWGA